MSSPISYNFLQRMLYSTIFIILGSCLLYTTRFHETQWIFVFAAYAIQMVALRELYAMMSHTLPITSTLASCSYCLSFILYCAHGLFGVGGCQASIFYLLTLLFIGVATMTTSIQNATKKIAALLFGAIYVTVPLLFSIDLAFSNQTTSFFEPHVQFFAPFWLVTTIFIAKGSDMAAYFFGKMYGRRPLAPLISPKKTVEGSYGGFFGAVIGFWISCALFQLFPTKIVDFGISTLFALFVGGISQLSDLIESLFKRDCAIKDSSNYIPGLGGILDIVDSLLFTIPLVYFIVQVS